MPTNRVRSAADAESIAVIGMKGRFPGARSIEALWANLKEGVESITSFSEAELRLAGIDPAYMNVPGYVNRGCVLDSIELFDAGFFGYSARDAETMDPQQRVFLELAWESLEDAGYDSDAYSGRIGVFAGCDQSSYLYAIYQNVDLSAYGYGGMMSIGNEKDYITTQVSYKLNLRGPSMAIQTSCSTSLVCVCMACESVLFGSCDMALAGGIGISVPQKRGYWYQPGGIVSPDGHCRAFDASSQGTVVGNGAGIVVLKRLSEALADGDQIYAVIRGFGLNNDGSAKVGYTAPGVDGQANAISAAHRMAGVEPDTLGYIEAHGTGTALGDPIEIAALTKAFRARTQKKQFCAVGTLKSNVGHLSSAAGIGGLIKAILAVKHGEIPKSLHFETPNPQIDFANSPFFVPTRSMPWPIANGRRRAGVSSFGVGGTNAHVVLEQAPSRVSGDDAPECQLLLLSARSLPALEQMTNNLADCVENDPALDLSDVAFTTQVGRRPFPHRRAMVFERSDRPGFLSALRARDPRRVFTAHTEMRGRPVTFMFSGQGTQYVNMGRGLYETDKTFHDTVDECADVLRREMNFDLRDVLYPLEDLDTEAASAQLTRTSITQPALFTVEYALARMWMAYGVRPKTMVGHSIGEYVAACLAGVLSLRDALAVVAMRGRLMESMPGGSMLAVSLPESALQPLLGPHLSLAAVNAPSLCVLSGVTPAIEALDKEFTEKGLMCRRLHTSHAFHSSMMDPVVRQFVDRLRRVPLKPPQIPFLSNVTGTWIKPELATSPEYWGTHLRQTVRFGDNLRELMVFPDLALLEVGPGPTLGFLARQQGSRANSQVIVASLRSIQEDVADSEFLRHTIAALWLAGVQLDWRQFHADEHRQRVSLPTYPFERQRFWLGPLEQVDSTQAAATEQNALPVSQLTGTTALGTSILGTPITSAVETAPAPTQAVNDISSWFFVPSWQRTAAQSPAAAAVRDGAWLVFADSGGLAERVVTRLRDLGAHVNTVEAGDAFSAEGGRFTIRRRARADYESLVRALRERDEYPSRILHLWSAERSSSTLSEVEAFDEAQERSFRSVTHLAQALGKLGGPSQVQVAIVTDQLQAVAGDEQLGAFEATVFGACKVIPQEYPNLRCRAIDVVASQSEVPDALVRELIAEPFAAVVAYRGGHRSVQRYTGLRLEPSDERAGLLHDGAVYLVTGGLGNIGLLLAEAIARQVKSKLILTGRSTFPDPAAWDAHLASHKHDQTSARIRKLRALEQLGAEVRVAQVDVTDGPRMEALVRDVQRMWGRIDGVIHCAANLTPDAFGPIRDISDDKVSSHFGPKAHGLLIIEDLLRAQPPDFYVLLSSLSAVLGGLGLATYAASNAFLDAEAQRRNRAGTSLWISTNWDAWDFSPGAASRSDVIAPSQGQEAFIRLLRSAVKQSVVSTSPLGARLDNWVNVKPGATDGMTAGTNTAPAVVTAAAASPAHAVHPRPDLSTQYAAPRTDTETKIVGVWEHLLGVAPIGIHDKFFELGGHSLLAIQLLARLREIFDLDIPVQRIFEAPTVAQLAQTIETEKTTAADVTASATDDEQKLQEVLTLVEGLSESELEALLSEAEALDKKKEAYG